MKKIYFSTLFFLSFITVAQDSIKKSSEDFDNTYIKLGFFSNRLTSNFNSVNLHFLDPHSGVDRNQSISIDQSFTNVGLDLGLFEKEYSNRIIFNPIHAMLSLNSFASKALYTEVGSGIGYELPFLKRDIKYSETDDDIDEGLVSVLKFRFGFQLDYFFYQKKLATNISSTNSSVIYVGDTPISKTLDVNLNQNSWKLTPNIGLNIRLRDALDLHLSAQYNLLFSSKESLVFKEVSQTSNHNKKTVDFGSYLLDSNGQSIHSVISNLSPWMFKIDIVYQLDL